MQGEAETGTRKSAELPGFFSSVVTLHGAYACVMPKGYRQRFVVRVLA